MPERPRRRVLRALGGALTLTLAGCTDSEPSPTATDAPTDTETATRTATRTAPATPTPTETATDSPTETDSPTPEPLATLSWRNTSFDGIVAALSTPNRPPTPEMSGGPLYAVTDTGQVANVRPYDGEIRWRFTAAGDPSDLRVPRVYERAGAVYVVSDTIDATPLRYHVERLNPQTGERTWRWETRHVLSLLGLVDGTLYFGGEYIRKRMSELGTHEDIGGEGRLFAVDAETGAVEWEQAMPPYAGGTAASHGIYVTTWQRENDRQMESLVALDLDGTERWRNPDGMLSPRNPVPTGSGVLAGMRGTDVAMVAPDGTERWTAGSWRSGPDEIVVTADGIFVGTNPLVFFSRDGTEHWRRAAGGAIVRPSRQWRFLDTLYLAGGSRVEAVDPDTGDRRWRWTPPDAEYTHVQAVIRSGIVVDTGIGSNNEYVVLDEDDGRERGRFRTRHYYRSSAAIRSQLFSGQAGRIEAYEVRTHD